jgi:hypothetical protein
VALIGALNSQLQIETCQSYPASSASHIEESRPCRPPIPGDLNLDAGPFCGMNFLPLHRVSLLIVWEVLAVKNGYRTPGAYSQRILFEFSASTSKRRLEAGQFLTPEVISEPSQAVTRVAHRDLILARFA